MANHYGRVKNNFDKMMYYFEKAAILGSVEARLFLWKTSYKSDDINEGVKHFVISAKQGDKESVTWLWKAYRDGNIEKGELEKVICVHRDAVTSCVSNARACGEAMYEEARVAKSLIGDLDPILVDSWV